jgi:hypothetical protein
VAQLFSLGGKRMIRVLPFLLIWILTGCVGSQDRHECDNATLVEQETNEIELKIFGSDGYIGFQTVGYGAALIGIGPVFTNPLFQDNPAHFRCIGTITLDREHKRVVVNMRRIISDPGQPERTVSHPANGTYDIDIVRPAASDEQQWFRAWLTNSINEKITH